MVDLFIVLILIAVGMLGMAFWIVILGLAVRIGQKIRDFIFRSK